MSEIQSNDSRPTGDAIMEEERRKTLAKRAGRFRILVIGRANAGKTTILKKICDTTEDPEIYNSRGEKVDASKINPTAQRGTHDIENEMVFQSHPGFIFHDSRGFEAGGVDELEKVKAFVTERSKEKKLVDQVHVIWYCIPMDDSRPITNAEIQFFSRSGTGKVPVVAIFTKCEALELHAIEILQEKKKLSFGDAAKGAADYAKEHLWNTHLELEKHKYHPQGHVYLQEMNKPGVNCKDLVKCTAAVLDGNRLQAIFVSTQQNSLELQVEYAIRSKLIRYYLVQASSQCLNRDIINLCLERRDRKWATQQDQAAFLFKMLKRIMGYFPYWVSVNFQDEYGQGSY